MSKYEAPSRLLPITLACLAVFLGTLILVAWLNVRGEEPLSLVVRNESTSELIERGAYLAKAGNCAACHTARGGTPYAGGRGIPTPFGTVYAGNLTPAASGIGEWSAAEFWRAMHHGRSKDGRLLYPAFPYPNLSLITRQDSDAIFTFLRSLPPTEKATRPHELKFPYNTQLALAVWRALNFKPTVFEPDTQKSAMHNRGAYLVQGLGHCAACHASKNVMGANSDKGFDGSVIANQNWYAPPLAPTHTDKAAFAKATYELLKNGVNQQSAVSGLMAEVVYTSTQHLTSEDLKSIAEYLSTLPPALESTDPVAPDTEMMKLGAKVYTKHCSDCHGKQGQGVPFIYPVLAGNWKVTMANTTNLQQIVKTGGFAPSTAANPRPYGMPPFAQTLSGTELAAVLTYVRNSWGNKAAPVNASELGQQR